MLDVDLLRVYRKFAINKFWCQIKKEKRKRKDYVGRLIQFLFLYFLNIILKVVIHQIQSNLMPLQVTILCGNLLFEVKLKLTSMGREYCQLISPIPFYVVIFADQAMLWSIFYLMCVLTKAKHNKVLHLTHSIYTKILNTKLQI